MYKIRNYVRVCKKIFLFYLVFAGIPLFSALPVKSETLEEAWKIAIGSDNRLKGIRETTFAAEESLSAAKSARFPSLKGEAGYSVLDETPSTMFHIPPLPGREIPFLTDSSFLSSSITLSVPVFTSGRISNSIDSAESCLEAVKADEEKSVLDLRLQVAEAYISVIRAESALELAKKNVKSLEAHVADTESMFKNGLVAKNDVLSAGVSLAEACQSELQIRNRLDIACSAYNRLLGRPLDQAVDLRKILPGNTKVRDLKQLESLAIEKRPEMRALSGQTQALHYQAKAIKAVYLPQIAANAGLHHFENTPLENENIWAATLGVKWDIFDGGAAFYQAESVTRKKMAVMSYRKDLESMIGLQTRQAWLDMNEAEKRIKVAENSVNQAEENLKVARNRYRQEIGSSTEVLDAETLRTRNLNSLNDAVYDSVLADFRLHRAVGDL